MESRFEKVKLNCNEISDPAMQLALLLHDSQTSNEVFLLSLRDCVVTLPANHPLRRWLQARSQQGLKTPPGSILEALDGELKAVWAADYAITPQERWGLLRLLGKLEGMPPYLDYVLLQAVAYLKLGNWSRAEKILFDWMEQDPLERMKQTPKRRDSLSRKGQELLPVLLSSLTRGLEGRMSAGLFLQAIQEFCSDSYVIQAARDAMPEELSKLLTNLRLKFHLRSAHGFGHWLLNRHQTGQRELWERFFLGEKMSQYIWVFYSQLPHEAAHRENLARELLLHKKLRMDWFFEYAQDELMSATLTRLSPEQSKGIISERRHYFLDRFRQDPADAWALAGLIKLGQVDSELVQALAP